jgi:hypothetical protein
MAQEVLDAYQGRIGIEERGGHGAPDLGKYRNDVGLPALLICEANGWGDEGLGWIVRGIVLTYGGQVGHIIIGIIVKIKNFQSPLSFCSLLGPISTGHRRRLVPCRCPGAGRFPLSVQAFSG